LLSPLNRDLGFLAHIDPYGPYGRYWWRIFRAISAHMGRPDGCSFISGHIPIASSIFLVYLLKDIFWPTPHGT